jgi:ABC-type nitrate/sulfonate/bicarbonate transport system substrate-binding protein
LKLALPDMLSNSYFPVLAARELGCFRDEGLDLSLELMSPADKTYGALAAGEVDFAAAEAHTALAVFPRWRGIRLLCALSQGMYWFLVMRSDIGARRGDVGIVRGRRIGASPFVDLGLRRLLADAGIDLVRDKVAIAPIPGGLALTINSGWSSAQALADRAVDGFWANGLGAEVAVRRGVGSIVLDVRRGDGPRAAFDYTFPALATTDGQIARMPDRVAGARRAIERAHTALKQDPALAGSVARKLFRAEEAELVAGLVHRDLPYYDPAISRRSAACLNRFARDVGLLDNDVPYEEMVALPAAAT